MHMRLIAAAAATLSACLAAAASPAGTSFLPGVYETVTTYAGGKKETSRHCAVSHGASRDTLETRLAAMSQDPNCRFTKRTIGGGRYAIAATCDNEGAKSSYEQSGAYTPTSMTMSMAMTLQVAPGQKPVAMKFDAVSRRVAATCPAGMAEE